MQRWWLAIPILMSTYGLVLFFNDSLFGIHLGLFVLIFVLLFVHSKSREIVVDLFPVIFYGMIYDLMRFIPNHTVNPIHIREPYSWEKALFGFDWNGVRSIPNEYYAVHTNTFWDVLSGITYLSWIPIPVALMIVWWIKDKAYMRQFLFAFVATNLIGFVVYYLYPAAPPWYVAQHGFELIADAKSSPAGLARFDAYFDVGIFQGMYGANPNIFGAIPSLHCANPVVVAFFISRRYGWIGVVLGIVYIALMWFSAVYSNHHYLVDALAGFGVACLGILLSLWVMGRKA